MSLGGAFFIRRSFRDNRLYATLLFEYLSCLIPRGAPVEYFIEGTRSRTDIARFARAIGESDERYFSAEAARSAGHRDVVAPLVFAFADRFTVGFYTTTFSLFASGLHGATPPRVGLWITAFMLPFALLSFPFGVLADRYSKTLLLCGGSFVYGVLTASLGFWPTGLIGIGMAVIGLSAASMFVPSMLMTTDLTPPSIRSTALGAFNTAGSLGFILGPLTGGFVSQMVAASHGPVVGYRAAFAVAGVAEILCALVALPFLLRLRAAGRTS